MAVLFNRTEQDDNHAFVHKFGYNADCDTAAAEDVWDGGGEYPWPTAAAETTIVSTDVADDAAGTGARTVKVFGLSDDYSEIEETVTLDGTTAVTLTNQYFRVFRAKVLTAGTGDVNAGNIQVKHGATVITQISIGYGQTLMAIFTIPKGHTAYLQHWYSTLGKNKTSVAEITLDLRSEDGAWQTKELIHLSNTSGQWSIDYPNFGVIDEKTDMRVRVRSVTANDTQVSAGFDLLMPWVVHGEHE